MDDGTNPDIRSESGAVRELNLDTIALVTSGHFTSGPIDDDIAFESAQPEVKDLVRTPNLSCRGSADKTCVLKKQILVNG
jgi:hypothetical protein